MTHELSSILRRLERLGSPGSIAGMARYGIVSAKVFGVSVTTLRGLAKSLGRDHDLARQLWSTGILEGRMLAALIEDPSMITERQMERWVKGFDNWALCDTCCSNLFDRTRFAWAKSIEWSRRKGEFEKRAGFALMATLAVHDKSSSDERFLLFLPLIIRESSDDRNFVRKAVNWALRQIGKRSAVLNRKAIRTARAIQVKPFSSARWIAADALRELTGRAVQQRIRKRAKTASARR
jgi:3-methyladenine DNA glycosylase AlkD